MAVIEFIILAVCIYVFLRFVTRAARERKKMEEWRRSHWNKHHD